MQAIVELALETPFELGMIEISRMEIEQVSVNRDRGILEVDHDFDTFSFGTRVKQH
jgi:hypothetical protein